MYFSSPRATITFVNLTDPWNQIQIIQQGDKISNKPQAQDSSCF